MKTWEGNARHRGSVAKSSDDNLQCPSVGVGEGSADAVGDARRGLALGPSVCRDSVGGSVGTLVLVAAGGGVGVGDSSGMIVRAGGGGGGPGGWGGPRSSAVWRARSLRRC